MWPLKCVASQCLIHQKKEVLLRWNNRDIVNLENTSGKQPGISQDCAQSVGQATPFEMFKALGIQVSVCLEEDDLHLRFYLEEKKVAASYMIQLFHQPIDSLYSVAHSSPVHVRMWENACITHCAQLLSNKHPPKSCLPILNSHHQDSSPCTHTHTFMHLCICTHTCTYTCLLACTCVHMHAVTHIHTHTQLSTPHHSPR